MKRRQHLLIISQYFYPEQFRINDLCKEWVKRGYEVTVLTGIPNYPQGKFYFGYGWLKKRKENYDGVHIVRLPLIPRGKNSLMLVLNYISFVFSGALWSLFTKIDVDKVFIFEVSPMTQALVGIWYKKRKKVPCYIYVQDLWPENVQVMTGIQNKKILGGIQKMSDYIYKNCEYIFATSPSFVKRIEEREAAYQNGKSKVIYWPQYAEDFYQPQKPKELPDLSINETFKVIFTGNIGYAQGLHILPKAARIVRDAGISCEFYIIGDGRYKKEFEKDIRENGVEKSFYLLGRKEPKEVPQYLANCNVAFLSFADYPLFEMTIPAKLQSYMACGIPILASASGETERIITESGAGLVCKIGDAESLAEKIKEYVKMPKENLNYMGEKAQKYCHKEFERSFLLDKMEMYFCSKEKIDA